MAAVCVLPPDESHPSGLIVTGSNDNTILMFVPGQLEAVCKLTGHTDTGLTFKSLYITCI